MSKGEDWRTVGKGDIGGYLSGSQRMEREKIGPD